VENNPSNVGGPASRGGSGNLVTEQVQQGAQQVVQQTQDAASQVAGQAQERARSMLAGQKDQVAQNISSISQALRQTSDQLRQQDQGAISQIPVRAADQLDRVSGYLNQRDVNQLVADLESFARRNSTIFLTGAFALGTLAARFLKSSAQAGGSVRQSLSQGGYGSGTYQGSYSYSTPPNAREDVGNIPPVDYGYKSGLTGESGTQSGAAGEFDETTGETFRSSGSPYGEVTRIDSGEDMGLDDGTPS